KNTRQGSPGGCLAGFTNVSAADFPIGLDHHFHDHLHFGGEDFGHFTPFCTVNFQSFSIHAAPMN
ncbi:MAG: hypothetical protein ABW117_17165, partial [Candidatus Sedimenticola sp. 1PA]